MTTLRDLSKPKLVDVKYQVWKQLQQLKGDRSPGAAEQRLDLSNLMDDIDNEMADRAEQAYKKALEKGSLEDLEGLKAHTLVPLAQRASGFTKEHAQQEILFVNALLARLREKQKLEHKGNKRTSKKASKR